MSIYDRSTRAFDAAGSDFARLGAHLWNPIGAATVAATGPTLGNRVLDACCGAGASAIPAARLVGPAGHVDAIDLSTALIGELTYQAADLPQLRTRIADATDWPSEGYDVVQAVLGIFFFPDMTAGTRHLITRARPGGRVGFTIWRRGAMEAAGEHLRTALAEVTGTTTPPRPGHLVDHLRQPEPFQAWLARQGLDDVTVTEYELALPLTPDIAWLVITGSGFVGTLAELDPGQVDAVRDSYLGSLARAGVTELDATTLIGVGTRAVSSS